MAYKVVVRRTEEGYSVICPWAAGLLVARGNRARGFGEYSGRYWRVFAGKGKVGLDGKGRRGLTLANFIVSVCAIGSTVLLAGGIDGPCVEIFSPPVYPPLAKVARVTGSVIVQFEVGPEGHPQIIAKQGNSILAAAAQYSVSKTQFDSHCTGVQSLKYSFEISDDLPNYAAPPVAFRYPDEYVIKIGPQPTICVLQTQSRKTWFKRLFGLR